MLFHFWTVDDILVISYSILDVIESTGPVHSFQEGIRRVLEHEEGDFAFMHDAAGLKHEVRRSETKESGRKPLHFLRFFSTDEPELRPRRDRQAFRSAAPCSGGQGGKPAQAPAQQNRPGTQQGQVVFLKGHRITITHCQASQAV